MQGNSIISDNAQDTLSFVDAGTGSTGYLGKAYHTSPDTNPAVEVIYVASGVYNLQFAAYNVENMTFSGTLAAAKAKAEEVLNAAGFIDFSVVAPATLTALNEDGTTLSFTIKSTNPWTISSDSAWLTSSQYSGNGTATVTITLADNAGAARNGILTISNGAVVKTYTIGQAVNA